LSSWRLYKRVSPVRNRNNNYNNELAEKYIFKTETFEVLDFMNKEDMVIDPSTMSEQPMQGFARNKVSNLHESFFEKFSASQVASETWDPVSLVGNSLSPLSGIDDSPVFKTVGFETVSVGPGTVSPGELVSSVATTVSNVFSDLEQSPLFGDSDLGDTASWESLFNDTEADHVESVVPRTSDQSTRGRLIMPSSMSPVSSPLVNMASFEQDQKVRSPSVEIISSGSKRKRSETPAYADKKDAHGITVYSRKPRSQALQPVVVDEFGDCVAVKRARNTEAARRSRARKMERMVQLEEKVDQLVSENSQLRLEVARLKKLYES
jgi:general control protein GCN4